MTRIGFLIDGFDNTPFSLALMEMINTHLLEHYDTEVIVFTQNHGWLSQTPMFSILSVASAYNVTSSVVATSIDTAEKLAWLPGPERKFFYIENYFWVHDASRSHKQFRAVLNNPKIELICKTDEIAKDVSEIWCCDTISLRNNFNINTFKEILKNGKGA